MPGGGAAGGAGLYPQAFMPQMHPGGGMNVGGGGMGGDAGGLANHFFDGPSTL